jgi:hypothetical protein
MQHNAALSAPIAPIASLRSSICGEAEDKSMSETRFQFRNVLAAPRSINSLTGPHQAWNLLRIFQVLSYQVNPLQQYKLEIVLQPKLTICKVKVHASYVIAIDYEEHSI